MTDNAPKNQQQRRAKYGANVAMSVILVLIILGAVNFMANRHSKRFDLTKAGENTLADQTVKVLKNLKEDVKMIAFFTKEAIGTEAQQREEFDKLTGMYKYVSKKIDVEYVDPLQQPAMVKKYDITLPGTIIVEQADRQHKVMEVNEETMTNALIKVTRGQSKSIYFLEGHGEKDPEDSDVYGLSLLKEALEKQNYEIKKLNLFSGDIPADAAALVIAGPRKTLADGEIRVLHSFLNNGGHMLIMLDPQEPSGLEGWLKSSWGISADNNLIIDVDIRTRLVGLNETYPLGSSYTDHPITSNFSFATFFPLARSVTPETQPPEGVSVKSLVQTSASSWAEKNLTGDTAQVEYNDGEDLPGPVSVIAVAEKPLDKTITEQTHPRLAKLVVSGDSDFAANQFNKMVGNGDFALNILNWLAGEEDLIAIPPKQHTFVPINLTESQNRFSFYFSEVILPAFILVNGIAIWMRRRKL